MKIPAKFKEYFPITADYYGLGARGSKFAFFL